MDSSQDTVIRISPHHADIIVEQCDEAGVMARKSLTPETLAKCILGSRFDESEHFSGLLPVHCIGTLLKGDTVRYFLRYPVLCADISYFGTVYEDFPLPRLVFSVSYDKESHKAMDPRLCVVKDERLTPETPTYTYPFSNVYGDSRICTGNNALPVYKEPTRIFTIMDYILHMPNNNDMFNVKNNRLGLGYRDLLEHLKDKTPAYYYTDVLIPDGKKLKDFFDRR